jgi:hypothetical protein
MFFFPLTSLYAKAIISETAKGPPLVTGVVTDTLRLLLHKLFATAPIPVKIPKFNNLSSF